MVNSGTVLFLIFLVLVLSSCSEEPVEVPDKDIAHGRTEESEAPVNKPVPDEQPTYVPPGELNAHPEWGDKILGALRDDQEVTFGQINPQIDGRLRGIPAITKVTVVSNKRYQELKSESGFEEKYRKNGFLYFDVDSHLCLPFPEGPSAIVEIVERYKVRLERDREQGGE